MKLLDTTEKLFPRDKVAAVVAGLQAEDQDWRYEAQHCPAGTGYSFINVYDEDGVFVGKF